MKKNASKSCVFSCIERTSEQFRKLAIIPIALLLLLALSNSARAVELVGWDVNGLASYGPSPYTPTTVAANLTAVGLTRGSGIGLSGTAAGNAWGGNAWNGNASKDAAIAANDFATFSVTANAGYSVSFTGIPAYNIRRSGTGPATGIWQYQVGAGAFVDIGSPITWGPVTTASGNPQSAIDLSGISALQNVPAGTTVTFRIVNWDATMSAGTWYVNNISGHDLQVEGTVDSAAGAPAAPVANDATSVNSSAFIANWTASPGATGYRLDVSTDSGFGSFISGYNDQDVSNVTSTAVTGLSANTIYYFRVRAYNASGTSGNSNVKSVMTSGVVAATTMTVTLPGQASANTGTPTAQTAGTPFNVTLKAVLNDGTTVDAGYSGTKSITFSGPTGSPVYPATVNFSSGIGTASITLSKAETTTISATDGLLTGIASSSLTVNAATYVWNVTSGSASWTDAVNWTPNRTAPGADDTLVFNQGGDSTATGVPAGAIANLQISNNTAITLQGSGVNTLSIGGGVNALLVGAGSALNVSGSTALTLSLPTGSSASISGAIDFAGAAHKLLATDANGVTFQNGATFTANTGFSSNPFGTANLNSIVFASGSIYIQKAGSNPFGASAPSSVVVFQSGSLYRVAGNLTPSFSGRTYADLEINSTGFNQSGTGGNPLTVSNITITVGTLNLNLTGAINIQGNVSVAAGQTLTFTPTGAGTVNFNGTATQSVGGDGTLSFGANAAVNVASGSTVAIQNAVTLLGTATVDGTLGGNGSITGGGLVTVSASGTLAPGSSIGTLSFDVAPSLNGGSYMELDHSATPNADNTTLTGGTFNFGGVLTVTNVGLALVDGDTFTLFSASSFSGAFTATNLPALSPGLGWDTSNLGLNGTIKVVSTGTPVTPPAPTLGSLAFIGGNVVVSGTNNAGAGGTYKLLTSTNASLPLTSWTLVTSGVFGSDGKFSWTNSVGTENQRFYMLQVP